MCLCGIDWTDISAIATLVMAILTFLTLCVSVYLIHDDRRPRLQFSIVKIEQAFYLKVKNIGSRAARKVKLKVEGEPIDNALFPQIRDAFDFLKGHSFYVEAGAEKYFCLGPDKLNHKKIDECGKWLIKDNEIPQWVEKYHNKDISIKATYNCIYWEKEKFSIQGFISLAAYRPNTPLEQVVDSLHAINKTLKEINKKWKN